MYLNDGIITSGACSSRDHEEAELHNNNAKNAIYNFDHDDDYSDEDIPEELKKDFVDEGDEDCMVYTGFSAPPNHTSTPARYIW